MPPLQTILVQIKKISTIKSMIIAPSILNADFSQLQAEIDSLDNADRIHLDIMDGKYVPATSFGAKDLEGIDFSIPTEAHLMCDNPEQYFDDFQKLGVMGITFHIENTGEFEAIRLLKDLKNRNLKAGICIDGYTEDNALSEDILNIADQILIMSVKAGKGGQSFMPEALEKCQTLRERNYQGEIEFDGGVKAEHPSLIAAAGGNAAVVGSFLTKKPLTERAALIENLKAS